MTFRFHMGTPYRHHCAKCDAQTLHTAKGCCHHPQSAPAAQSVVNTPIGTEWAFNNKTLRHVAARNSRRALAGMRAGR